MNSEWQSLQPQTQQELKNTMNAMQPPQSVEEVKATLETTEKGGVRQSITHDAECALACCERAIRLENGCITDDFQIRGAELLLDKIGYDKKEG